MPMMPRQNHGFRLEAGPQPNTVAVIDIRNNRIAFVLECVWVENIDVDWRDGVHILELRLRGLIGDVPKETQP